MEAYQMEGVRWMERFPESTEPISAVRQVVIHLRTRLLSWLSSATLTTHANDPPFYGCFDPS